MFEKLKYFIGTIGWFLLAVLLILGLAYLLFPDLIQNVFDCFLIDLLKRYRGCSCDAGAFFNQCFVII